MRYADRSTTARRTALALTLCAAFAPLRAQENAAEGSLGIGVGGFSGDRAERSIADQYGGLRSGRGGGLLGGDYYRRNVDTGTMTSLSASHLLDHSREVDFRWKKQGDWSFGAAYREQLHHDPATLRSGQVGAGTTTPQVVALPAGSGSDVDLTIKRTRLGLVLSKVIDRDLQFDVGISSENKEGARLSGIGFSCPSAIAPGCRPGTGTETGSALLLLPEPIKSNHTQIDARASYAVGRLRLSAGYYGSFYSNAYDTLRPTIPASLYNPAGTLLPLSSGLQAILAQPVALPPDNQAHQVDLAGTYAFGTTTHANFKLAFARATQQQDFAASGLSGAPPGSADLGGRIDTTLAQLGITSRPTPKLSLLARLRHEDRDDRTPIALYNVEGTSSYTNRRLPRVRTSGTLQAALQLPYRLRATIGIDGEAIDRGVFTASSAAAGISALRQKTDEIGVRAELRRTLTETLGGAIRIASSRRTGSNWLRDNSGTGVTEIGDPAAPGSGLDNAIFMPTLADRRRDMLRLSADWQPNEQLTLQFSGEDGRDRYSTPTSTQGLRSSGANFVNVDWTWAVAERWNLNGYLSRGTSRLHQARPAGYILSFDNVATQLGLGISGKPTGKLAIGGGLVHSDDRSVYQQQLDATAAPGSAALLAATGGLPDIVFRRTELRLFGDYALDKHSSLRVDLSHQRLSWNDWNWGYAGVPFVLADGTTVYREPTQHVSFIGDTWRWRWP